MTESIGSRSDTSGHGHGGGHTTPVCNRLRMDAVCVIDLHRPEVLNQRKKAFEEAKQACALVNANCHHVQVLLNQDQYIFKKKLVFNYTCNFLSVSLKNLISGRPQFWKHFTMLMLHWLICLFKFNRVHCFITWV